MAEQQQDKKAKLITGISAVILAAILVGVIWIICAVSKVGMYEVKPYTFVNEKSVNYVLADKEGDTENTYLVLSVNTSGKKLDKIYYSFDNNQNKTEIKGTLSPDEKKANVNNFASYIIEIPVEKSIIDTENKEIKFYSCLITAYDTDNNLEVLGEIIIKNIK